MGNPLDALDGTHVREASEPKSEAQAVGGLHRRKAGISTRKKPEAKADDKAVAKHSASFGVQYRGRQ